jgi:hypothetical protein
MHTQNISISLQKYITYAYPQQMLLPLHTIPVHKLDKEGTANGSILFHTSLIHISNKQLMPWEGDSSWLFKKFPALMKLKGLSELQSTRSHSTTHLQLSDKESF